MVCVESLCVMMTTPANVRNMDNHTGHEGITFRKTMMMATRTGSRNTSAVARPDAIYLNASNRNMLLEV